MRIRVATIADIPALINFQKKMGMETEGVSLDERLLLNGIHGLLADPNRGKYYVTEMSETLIACLMTTFEWSEWRNGNILWIQSVYVSKEFRGIGIYKRMYRHVQEIVRKDPSLKGIRLYAEKTNTTARSVYEKLGMDGDHYTVYEWIKTDSP